MEPETPFKQRVAEAIEAHLKKKEEPPFSVTQLIVVALVLSDMSMTAAEIAGWICRNFDYYNDLAFGCFWSITKRYSSGAPTAANKFRSSFDKTLRGFECPLKIHTVGKEKMYDISELDAQSSLSGIVPAKCSGSGTFPFFQLAAELRVTIYELLFRYPISGMTPRPHTIGKIREFTLATQDLVTKVPAFPSIDEENPWEWGESIVTRPLLDILAPLKVSRQFYQEALPYFFAINHFRFESSSGMACFIQALSPERRRLIRHISVQLRPYPSGGESRIIKHVMPQLDGLKRFHVHFDEKKWLEAGTEMKAKKYESVAGADWIGTLKRMRGLEEVTFTDCPGVEALVKDAMMQPKKPTRKIASTKGASKKGKRKGEIEEGSNDLRRSMRTKKAKT